MLNRDVPRRVVISTKLPTARKKQKQHSLGNVQVPGGRSSYQLWLNSVNRACPTVVRSVFYEA
jgi:hypothetical protein